MTLLILAVILSVVGACNIDTVIGTITLAIGVILIIPVYKRIEKADKKSYEPWEV